MARLSCVACGVPVESLISDHRHTDTSVVVHVCPTEMPFRLELDEQLGLLCQSSDCLLQPSCAAFGDLSSSSTRN